MTSNSNTLSVAIERIAAVSLCYISTVRLGCATQQLLGRVVAAVARLRLAGTKRIRADPSKSEQIRSCKNVLWHAILSIDARHRFAAHVFGMIAVGNGASATQWNSRVRADPSKSEQIQADPAVPKNVLRGAVRCINARPCFSAHHLSRCRRGMPAECCNGSCGSEWIRASPSKSEPIRADLIASEL